MKYILSCCLLLIIYYSHADVPGNKPRPSYDVTFTGLHQYPDYIFFYQSNNVVVQFYDSSSIHVPGGYGAPQCAEVWAINKKNFIHTDTLSFCSGDEEQSKTIIVTINDRHLTYSSVVTKKKNKNTIPFSTFNNNQNINVRMNKDHLIMYLISGLSFIVLVALLFFVLKKNKQPKLQQSV